MAVAKVKQTIDHETKNVRVTSSWEGAVQSTARRPINGSQALRACCQLIDASFLIRGFCFETESPEIITDETTKVVTCVVISGGIIPHIVHVKFDIFNDHWTSFEPDIPTVLIMSYGWSSERC